MYTSVVVLGTTCCPKWNSFVNDITSNSSDVAIVLIISLTVLVSFLTICSKLFTYLAERDSAPQKQNAINELHQQIEDLVLKVDALVAEKNKVEKKLQLTQEQKEKNRFFDFCYDMARSTERDNLKIKSECWEILKKEQGISIKIEEENEE